MELKDGKVSKCSECSNPVPRHFKAVGIKLCMACQSDAVDLSFKLKPGGQHPKYTHCVLCLSKLPGDGAVLCKPCLVDLEELTGRSEAKLMENQNRPWLLKSASRIHGPLSSEELTGAISRSEVVPLDEVARPFGRWHYLREEKEFDAIFKEIAKSKISSDDTNASATETLTERTTAIQTEEVPRENSVKVYGLPDHQKRGSRWFSVSLIGFGVLIAVAFYVKTRISASNQNKSGENALCASRALLEGQIKEAIPCLEASYSARPDDQNLGHQLVLAYIADGQTVPASRLLQNIEAAENETDVSRKRIFQNARGLVDLANEDLDKAQLSFEAILAEDPSYRPALVNLATTELKKKNYEKVTKIFEGRELDGASSLLYLHSVIKLLEAKPAEEATGLLQKAEDAVAGFLRSGNDYRQEVLLALSFGQHISKAIEKSDFYAERFLNMDPNLAEDSQLDLSISQDQLRWQVLAPWCAQLATERKDSPRIQSMTAICLLKGDQKLQAQTLVDGALANGGSDPLFQGAYAYISDELGQREKAHAALELALKSEVKYEMPLLLKARLCERENDFQCAEQYWKALQELNPTSLAALDGLIRWNLREKNDIQARKLLSEGLMLSPTYIPFQKLKAEVGEQ